MIHVLLFGRLSELHSSNRIEMELTESLQTPDDVRTRLGNEFPKLGKALNEPQILVAVNHQLTNFAQPLQDGDELAFLPPVTGG